MKPDLKKLPAPLPAGVQAKDLKYPSYKDTDKQVPGNDRSFDLYCVAFSSGETGWVIPTLHIGPSRMTSTARTYAVRVPSGSLCRVGNGPHVKARLTVYVRESSKARLQPLLDLRAKGTEQAHQTRDRISSRRAQGQVMRAQGRRSWRWEV